MDIKRIAVVNQSEQLSPGAVERATAAVQKQVVEDFGPAWGVSAVVSVFSSLTDRPSGYWPVVIRDEIGINQPGAHVSEDGDKPFALVLFTGKSWTITLSHEILEMLVDPFGKTRITGPSTMEDQGEVEYLAEVCDPCQAEECSYLINGDQRVTDFVLPAYYKAFGLGKYSQTGFVTEPRQVLAGGYVTWHDLVMDKWWQAFDDGSGTQFRRLDEVQLMPDIHLRGLVDRHTAAISSRRRRRIRNPLLVKTQKRNDKRIERYVAVSRARAEWWQAEIDRACRPAEPAPGKSVRRSPPSQT